MKELLERAGDGKTLWAVGRGGTILHSIDGEAWKAQTSAGLYVRAFPGAARLRAKL